MEEPPPHPLCEPIAFLLGTWHGNGHGGYPEMRAFTYREEMRVWHTGKAYLAFEQRTWELDEAGTSGHEIHGESGYLAAGTTARWSSSSRWRRATSSCQPVASREAGSASRALASWTHRARHQSRP